MRILEILEDGRKGRLSAARAVAILFSLSAIALGFASVALVWHSPENAQPVWLASLVGEFMVGGLTALGLRTKAAPTTEA